MNRAPYLGFLLLITCFLLPGRVFAAVLITEIMYDLPGSDTGREWVEVTNTGSDGVDISSYKLSEGGTNHALTIVSGTPTLAAGQSAIIASNTDKFLVDWPQFAGTLFKSSFSLSNTGETVSIKDKSLNVLDSASYTSDAGAAGDGNTLHRVGDTLVAGAPDPGAYGAAVSTPAPTPAPDPTPTPAPVQDTATASNDTTPTPAPATEPTPTPTTSSTDTSPSTTNTAPAPTTANTVATTQPATPAASQSSTQSQTTTQTTSTPTPALKAPASSVAKTTPTPTSTTAVAVVPVATHAVSVPSAKSSSAKSSASKSSVSSPFNNNSAQAAAADMSLTPSAFDMGNPLILYGLLFVALVVVGVAGSFYFTRLPVAPIAAETNAASEEFEIE